jgi:hypothetical protein
LDFSVGPIPVPGSLAGRDPLRATWKMHYSRNTRKRPRATPPLSDTSLVKLNVKSSYEFQPAPLLKIDLDCGGRRTRNRIVYFVRPMIPH